MGEVDLRFTFISSALLAVSAFALSGCASNSIPVGSANGLTIVKADGLPAPAIGDISATERPYRVGPFDKLVIGVFGSEELTDKEIQVDASGRMSFPLVGTVAVAGKTPGEIEEVLEGLFRGRFVKNPQITVNLKEIVSQKVTIGGEVKEPGVYPVIGKMTLMRAVATAKGTTEYSKKKEVIVFRTVGGKDYAAVYDMNAIQRGNYADPEVFPNDVVVVGESAARRTFRDFLQASPLLAPLIYILNNN